MAKLLGLGFAGSFMIDSGTPADDFADQLSYKYTVNMLLLYAFIVTAKSYIIGEPIHCWVPAHFTGNHEEYTNNYCWVRNTYYVPMNKQVPGQFESEEKQVVTYYQWMAFILLIQALLFHLPVRIWHSFCQHSGLDIVKVVEAGKSLPTMMGEKQETALCKIDDHMTRYLKDGLKSNRPGNCSMSPVRLTTCTCCPLGSRKHGTYLVTRYIIVKFIYLANVIGQFFFLNNFLGYDFHLYGIHVLSAAIKGESWSESPRFPRVTLCDLNVRRLANVQRYTVQCVLPINLFNEKLFFIMWFWFLVIMIVTTFSIFRWCFRLATEKSRQNYVRKHVTLKKELRHHVTTDRLNDFIRFLRRDGLFTLRLLGHNINTIAVSEVMCHMWKSYFNFTPPDNIEEQSQHTEQDDHSDNVSEENAAIKN